MRKLFILIVLVVSPLLGCTQKNPPPPPPYWKVCKGNHCKVVKPCQGKSCPGPTTIIIKKY